MVSASLSCYTLAISFPGHCRDLPIKRKVSYNGSDPKVNHEFIHVTTYGEATKAGKDKCLGSHAISCYGDPIASHRYSL